MSLAVKTAQPVASGEPVDAAAHFAIAQFVNRCAWLIDEDKLEEMLEMFDPSAMYQVLPLENLKQGLPSSLMRCSSRNMLRDRIVGLREATVFNLHTDRHILGFPVVEHAGAADEYKAKTSFACYQTNQEGVSTLFAVGYYDDHISLEAGRQRFLSRTVVLETFAVPSLIGVPL